MEVKQSLVVAMPKSALAFLTEFYASSVAIIPEFRFYAYKVSLNQLIHVSKQERTKQRRKGTNPSL